MGNASTTDRKYKSTNSFDKKKSQGLTASSLGRHTSPNFNTKINKIKSKTDNRKRESSNNLSYRSSDINFNVFKDIFPVPSDQKTRNTMTPLIRVKTFKNDFMQKLSADFDRDIAFSSKDDNRQVYQENRISNTFESPRDKKEIQIYSKTEPNENSENTEKCVCNEFELKLVKSGDDIRKSYIAKLIYKKIWQPTIKEKDHNTIIIFDWDDTLLCTSFLTPNGVFSDDVKISDKDFEKIKKLEVSALQILKAAISKGNTYIVTNAAPGWVEYSANRFYPEVAKILHRVKIVSARGEYEKKYPGDSRQWKILAFLEMLKDLDTNLVTNLICLGDSIIEMEAAHILASKFEQAYIKTIKFREAPKPEELHKQLNLVIDQFNKVFSEIKNLTIRVERKPKDKKETSM